MCVFNRRSLTMSLRAGLKTTNIFSWLGALGLCRPLFKLRFPSTLIVVRRSRQPLPLNDEWLELFDSQTWETAHGSLHFGFIISELSRLPRSNTDSTALILKKWRRNRSSWQQLYTYTLLCFVLLLLLLILFPWLLPWLFSRLERSLSRRTLVYDHLTYDFWNDYWVCMNNTE